MSIAQITDGETAQSVTDKWNDIIDRSNFQNPLHGQFDLSRSLAWDSFNRADAGSLGTSDSGHTWTDLVGDGFTILSNTARVSTAGNISVVDVSGETTGIRGRTISIEGSVSPTTSFGTGFVHAVDSDNYFELIVYYNQIIVNQVISGTETELDSWTFPSAIPSFKFRELTVDLDFSLFKSTQQDQMFLLAREKKSLIGGFIDVTTHLSLFNDTDYKYVGITSNNNGEYVYNFHAKGIGSRT